MDDEKQEREDGSQPERGTGMRQDHRAAPRGHRVPGEPPNLDDAEAARERPEKDEATKR
jgi:hypothetical protein